MVEPLRRKVRVRCSVAHAFEVFTQSIDLWWPPGHRRFDRSELRLEAAEGGRFIERAASGEEFVLGEVLCCEPPNHISYTWRPGAIKEPTRVEISFAEDGEGTMVHVVHAEGDGALGDGWPSRVAMFEKGWTIVLGAFSAQFSQPKQP